VLSALWLPDSVLLCCLLFTRARWWWVYWLVSLSARYYFGTHMGMGGWRVLANFPIDWLRAIVSVYLLRRFAREPIRLDSLRQFGVFFGVVVVGSPASSALVGATIRCALGQPFSEVWYQWFLSCALAGLAVTPALVYWIAATPKLTAAPPQRYAEALLLSAGLFLTAYDVFCRSGGEPAATVVILYAPVPFLIWATARFGPVGASTAIAVVGILAMQGARQGRGPFLAASPADNVLGMQLFLAVLGVPLLLLSILITERKKTEESLRQAMAGLETSQHHLHENFEQIQKLNARLLNAHEDARKNISRELHDGVSQQLTGALLELTGLKHQPSLPESGKKQLDAVLPVLSQVAADIRNLSRQLHPMVVEYVGLSRALQTLCADGRSFRGMEVEFLNCELPSPLAADSAAALYRVAQEALHNAAYHSGSRRTRVELAAAANRVQLRVIDWGCGFDVDRARRKGGLGLISMQERVESLHGTLHINSRIGRGTEIVAEVPLQMAA
jgi:signal transduction histidine kinase